MNVSGSAKAREHHPVVDAAPCGVGEAHLQVQTLCRSDGVHAKGGGTVAARIGRIVIDTVQQNPDVRPATCGGEERLHPRIGVARFVELHQHGVSRPGPAHERQQRVWFADAPLGTSDERDRHRTFETQRCISDDLVAVSTRCPGRLKRPRRRAMRRVREVPAHHCVRRRWLERLRENGFQVIGDRPVGQEHVDAAVAGRAIRFSVGWHSRVGEILGADEHPRVVDDDESRMLERVSIGGGGRWLAHEDGPTCLFDLLSGPPFLIRDLARGSTVQHHPNTNAGELPRDNRIDQVGVVQRVDPEIDAGGGAVDRGSDLLEQVIGRDQNPELGGGCPLRGRDISRPRDEECDDGGECSSTDHVASSSDLVYREAEEDWLPNATGGDVRSMRDLTSHRTRVRSIP